MPKKRQARKKRQRKGLWRRIVAGGVLLLVAAASLVAWITYRELTYDLPSVGKLLRYELPVATRVFARDGALLGEFYTEKRYLVPIARIPPVVRQAFIAAEDSNFYRHNGVDVSGIARAAVANFTAGGVVQGGSTITQQVVKSLLLTPEKSYERKAKEILLSLRLERELSKDEILYLYLNLIYLGSGSYGIGAAAKEYFGKDVSQLTVAEAALLAGLPQAPSRYSPRRHWKRAKHRQRYVLERMAREQFVTWKEAEKALRTPIELTDHGDRTPAYLAAPYFVEHVRRLLEERYGGTVLRNAGLNVHTTVDLADQRVAEEALREQLRKVDRGRTGARPLRRLSAREAERYLASARTGKSARRPVAGRSYRGLIIGAVDGGGFRVQLDGSVGHLISTKEIRLPRLAINDLVAVRRLPGHDTIELTLDTEPQLEGAVVSIDLANGDVRALVGGYDFRRSQFNRAMQALRQPGSAFKPFVFAAALDRGYTTASVLVDEPIVLPGHREDWAPRNYDKKFVGPITLRKALALSRNVVTVKLAQNIGLNYLVDYLPRFGFGRDFERHMAISLGTAEVTPFELTQAYSVFANQGRRVKARFITKIVDPHGTVLEEFPPTSESVVSPETAYLVTSMLTSVVERGTAKRVRALGRPAAGKTGTTNNFHDAWFVGYTPELVTGVWVGYDSERSLGKKQTGGSVAAPIFVKYMKEVLGDAPVSTFAIPEGISCVSMSDNRTRLGADMVECFKEGTAPRSGPPSEQLFSDELDSVIGRLRLRHIGGVPQGDGLDEDNLEPFPGGVEVIDADERGRDWGQPVADDYLPPDADRAERLRFEQLDDDAYRARLRRRFQRELGDPEYRPVRAPEPNGGIIEESLQ